MAVCFFTENSKCPIRVEAEQAAAKNICELGWYVWYQPAQQSNMQSISLTGLLSD